MNLFSLRGTPILLFNNELKLIEPRGPIVLTIIGISALFGVLPEQTRVFSLYFAFAIGILVLVPMLALMIGSPNSGWLQAERVVTHTVALITGLALLDQLRILFLAMMKHSAEITGPQLLSSSVAFWTMNVLLFSIVYWRIDRGGPEARANQIHQESDWLFPEEILTEEVSTEWQPTFFDYLFLSFCTAAGFSPARETEPLTSRATWLLMVESSISFIMIVGAASHVMGI